jgi:hypothetical protein
MSMFADSITEASGVSRSEPTDNDEKTHTLDEARSIAMILEGSLPAPPMAMPPESFNIGSSFEQRDTSDGEIGAVDGRSKIHTISDLEIAPSAGDDSPKVENGANSDKSGPNSNIDEESKRDSDGDGIDDSIDMDDGKRTADIASELNEIGKGRKTKKASNDIKINMSTVTDMPNAIFVTASNVSNPKNQESESESFLDGDKDRIKNKSGGSDDRSE